MLTIENLLYENNHEDISFKINFAKFSSGEAISLQGDEMLADKLIAILSGRVDGWLGRVFYDEELVDPTRSSLPFSELSVINYFYPEMTLNENIFYFAGQLGLSRSVIAQRLKWFLHFFELDKSLNKKCQDFTSEEVVVISFLISVIRIPKILLIGCDFPKSSFLFHVENYAHVFQDLQRAGTIFIYKNSWSECFKGHKSELILKRSV